MSKSSSKLFMIVVVGLLMLSCSGIEYGQVKATPQRVLEPNDRFEILWHVSDLILSSNNRRSSMVGVPGKIVIIGSKRSDLSGGKVIGLDSLTGNIMWTSPGASLGDIISQGENLYFGTYGTATLLSYNIENGEVLWDTRLPWAHSTFDIYFADDKIFVHTNDDEFFVLNEQGEILDSFSETHRTFLEMDGVLYMEDIRAIKAVDYSSRKELWRLDLGTGYTYAPIFDNGTIFLRTGGDTAFIYSIDQYTGKVNWKTSQDALSNLYVMDNIIYFMNRDSSLAAIDKYSGNEILTVKFLPPFNLNDQSGSYFVSGDPTNNMLALYFGDNSQIVGLKIKNP